ncbi:MAG: hypothetical protein JST80_01410 [Bdellovibrionales bacterium]|nr:hypothetical protein [Bdellovibrionales bacterium]
MSDNPHGQVNARRNPLSEEADSEGSWAISYGDMITLLLTFFILFFNVNKHDNEQRMAMQETLMEKLKAVSKPINENTGADRKPSSLEPQVEAAFGTKAYTVGERVVIEFPELSFFNKGDTEVSKEGVKKLREFVKLYEPFMGSNMLSVRAFTDTLKVMGNHRYKDNLELSALRAIAAMRVMQYAGIPIHLMRISGNGEFQSVMTKIQEEAFRRQGDPLARKVVLVIEPKTEQKI